MTNKTSSQIAIYLFLLTNAVSTFAQTATGCNLGTDDAPQISSIACILARIISLMLICAGAIFVGMIGYGAIKLGMAQGDPKGYQGAKDTWTWALIGVAIILGVGGIFSVVGKLFGINFLDPQSMVSAFESQIISLFDLAISGN
jgi:hypothetical protein